MKRKFPKKKKARSRKVENHHGKTGEEHPGKQARPDQKMGNLVVSPFLNPDSEKDRKKLADAEANIGPNSPIRKMLKKATSKKRRQHDNSLSKDYREDFS